MKNKKGFTLVELLAVIAILAILAIVAMPRILDLFNDAKKDTFLIDVRTLYKNATTKYMSEALKGNTVTVFSSNGENKLDIDNDNLEYYIVMDDKGKVTYIDVTDGNNSIQTNKTDPSSLGKNDIKEEIDTSSRPIPGLAMYGDVNKDGVVNQTDSDIILNVFAGNMKILARNRYLFDLNCDGSIDSVDALRVQRVASGEVTGSYASCNIYQFGDINHDGNVDNDDVQSLMSYIVGNHTITDNDRYLYDIDCNGIIDVSDSVRLLQILEGKTQPGDYKTCQYYSELFGDVNGDEIVNKTDSDVILEVSVGNTRISDSERYKFDLNCDGYIDSSDALIAQRVAKGTETGSYSNCSLY